MRCLNCDRETRFGNKTVGGQEYFCPFCHFVFTVTQYQYPDGPVRLVEDASNIGREVK